MKRKHHNGYMKAYMQRSNDRGRKHVSRSQILLPMSEVRSGGDTGATGHSCMEGSKRFPPVELPPEPEKKRPPIRPPLRDPQPEPIQDPPVPPSPGKDTDDESAPIGDPPDKSDQPMRMDTGHRSRGQSMR